MLRIITPRDYRVMPWKNGGGTTTEIYIHPEAAGWDDFEWRVGIADIRQSGPFSSFPGIDRSILLLECPAGSGMRLTINGAEVDLPLREFVDFAGDAATSGVLLGAPVRDFNVMSRRGRVRHQCGYQQLAPGAAPQWAKSDWRFAHVVEGRAVLDSGGLQHAISAGESMLADGPTPLEFRAEATGCAMVWAAFSS